MSKKAEAALEEKLKPIALAICESDFNWMIENSFEFFMAVESAVNNGASPEDIYRFMMRETHDGRQGFAVRCRNAATHMIRLRSDLV